MGYTHYWQRKENHDQETWDKFVADCKMLAKNLKKLGKVEYRKQIGETDALKEVEDYIMINGCYGYKYPVFNKDMIYFNGTSVPCKDRVKEKEEGSGSEYWSGDPDDYGHETFAIHRKFKSDFEFCKTAHKPYDIMVTACLILYKYYFKKDVEVSSDGDLDEWEDGFKFIAAILPHGKQVGLELLSDNGKELFERCLDKSA